MSEKTYVAEEELAPASQIGATIDALGHTISERRNADESSYTYRLLTDDADVLLKKVTEEAGEVALAAKDVEALMSSLREQGIDDAGDLSDSCDKQLDHLRYEAADVVYHLLVVLERYGISLDEFAAELNNRMNDEERPQGAIRLFEDHVVRGK